MRVFLSSTSEDLALHRQAILKLLARGSRFMPVAMESFGSIPMGSVQACRELVRSCDAVIVVQAWRYGWVPTPARGGDGRKSITWLEMEAAEGRPVFVYLVDPNATWTYPKESDSLRMASTQAEALAVWELVKNLEEFRSLLGQQVRSYFTTPDELAGSVVADLNNWFAGRTAEPVTPNATIGDAYAIARRFEETLTPANARATIREFWARWPADVQRITSTDAVTVLSDALRVTRTTIGVRAPEVMEFADAVLQRTDAMGEGRVAHGRAWLAKGTALAQQVRKALDEAAKTEGPLSQEVWVEAERARAALQLAADLTDDFDAWGTLGGHLKRMLRVSTSPEQLGLLTSQVLDAYRLGALRSGNHTYPLLNYFEFRATVEPHQPLLRNDDERSRLRVALAARQTELDTDPPWAAFDLARGYHYLSPNPSQFLVDLQRGVRQARTLARRQQDPSQTWMVVTTLDSLRALQTAGVPLPGLTEGVALLENAIHPDRWLARDEAEIEKLDAVQTQLLGISLELGRLRAQADASKLEVLAALQQAAVAPVTEADRQKFEADAAAAGLAQRDAQDAEVALALWKIGGKEGLTALASFIPVPGAGFAAAVALNLLEYMVEKRKAEAEEAAKAT